MRVLWREAWLKPLSDFEIGSEICKSCKQMFKDIEVVGNDLLFRGRIASPTIKMSEMMVAGN